MNNGMSNPEYIYTWTCGQNAQLNLQDSNAQALLEDPTDISSICTDVLNNSEIELGESLRTFLEQECIHLETANWTSWDKIVINKVDLSLCL